MLNTLRQADLFDLCDEVASAGLKVDLILADLPYGTTAARWDKLIPLGALWKALRGVIKPNGAIVLTASQPFTTALIVTNLAEFRYSWVWEKTVATNYLNANRQPLKRHEDVLVFSQKAPVYYPIMRAGKAYKARRGAAGEVIRDKTVKGYETVNAGLRHPDTILRFPNERKKYYAAQKPLALWRYLIETYTLPGGAGLRSSLRKWDDGDCGN